MDFIKQLANAKTAPEKQITYQRLMRHGMDKATIDYILYQYKNGMLRGE